MNSRKPCAMPGCPALRAKGSYVCAAHKKLAAQKAHAPGPRGHKYSAVATTVRGIRFASKAEAAHYQDLLLREKAGQITELRLQTRWPLLVNGTLVGHYVSDFDYWERDDWATVATPRSHLVVVDVKGVRTPLYVFKRRCFEALYHVAVTEVGRGVDKQLASK